MPPPRLVQHVAREHARDTGRRPSARRATVEQLATAAPRPAADRSFFSDSDRPHPGALRFSPVTSARPRAALSPSRPNRCSPYQFGAPGGCASHVEDRACARSTASGADAAHAQPEPVRAHVAGAQLVPVARGLEHRARPRRASASAASGVTGGGSDSHCRVTAWRSFMPGDADVALAHAERPRDPLHGLRGVEPALLDAHEYVIARTARRIRRHLVDDRSPRVVRAARRRCRAGRRSGRAGPRRSVV